VSGQSDRRRRRLRIGGAALATVALVAGCIAYWALDRYVIDHVEIADVRAYEAEQLARSAGAGATAMSVPTGTVPVGAVLGSIVPGSTEPGGAPADGASTAGPSSGAAEPSTTVAPQRTATSYRDGTAAVDVRKVVTGSGASTVTYYVADVVLGDTTRLRSAFADDKFGLNVVADTSDIAAAHGAVFAINGDYYGFRTSGIVIRNGVLYRDAGARTGLAVKADGTMAIYDETTTSGAKLLAEGVRNTLSFGPALVDDGAVVEGIDRVEVDTNFGNHSIQGNQPRTGLGMIGPGHFVFVAVDGRSTGYSRGVTMTEFARIFVDLGATVAYNLDGGGSTTMVLNGALVNNPLGKGQERGTSDILYIA